jgi:hypothetical protein
MCSNESDKEGKTTPLPRRIAVENGDHNEKITKCVENRQDAESCYTCKESDTLTLPQKNGCRKQLLSPCYNDQSPCTCTADHRNQQEIISRPLTQTPTALDNAIVITGFDPIYDPRIPNQSWMIVQKFCSQFQQNGGLIDHNSIPFQLMTGPPDCPNQPITTTYEYVTSQDFNNWLQLSNALLYIHVGVDYNLNSLATNINVFSFTTVAANGYDGYWGEDKKFYRYSGPCIENGDDYLYTQFSDGQLSSVVSCLQDGVRKGINGDFTFQQMIDYRKCGKFLCNFLYYRSLYYAKQRNEARASSDDRKSYVIFIHIPSKLKPSDLAGAAPMALVLNLIVHALLDIVTS